MGDIIHIDFEGKRREEQKQEPKSPTEEIGDTVLVQNFSGEDDAFRVLRDVAVSMGRIKKMEDYLRSLQFSANTSTVSLRKDLVKDMSVKQIVDTINNSSEPDWKVRPSYYQAVIERFMDRDFVSEFEASLIPPHDDKK